MKKEGRRSTIDFVTVKLLPEDMQEVLVLVTVTNKRC